MKNILLSYQDIYNINIGDYIQSLAAQQYFNETEEVISVNRDELLLYKGEKAKVIMNGWFTYKPKTWIPSDNITPLFVAFHLNSSIKEEALNNLNISYLKKHEPIGCRDSYTQNILSEKGINAYYSGCLTTTLGYNYSIQDKEKKDIFIVDPYSYMPNGKGVFELFKTFYQFISNYKSIIRLLKKYKNDNQYTINFSKIGIGRLLLLTKTYLLLKELLDEELIWKARYITHYYMHNEYPTDKERFDRAKELLNFYGNAKYVITSRIHCAFPCLGLNTPVAYIRNLSEGDQSTCRLENTNDLLNIISLKGNKILSNFINKKFTSNTIFSNKKEYLKNRNLLIEKCSVFFSK